MHIGIHCMQALARLVAKLFRAEAKLEQEFEANRDNEIALRRALKSAAREGLTPSVSRTMSKVLRHLTEARNVYL